MLFEFILSTVIFEFGSTMYVVKKETNVNNNSTMSYIEKFKKLYPIEKWKSSGYFDENYIDKINPYWLQFEPTSQFSHFTLGVIYIFIMIVGFCGNFMVIFMFIRCKNLRTSGNILVMNLAITDCLMMFEIPFFLYNTFYEGPALGEKGCLIYGFLGGLSGCGSIMTLTSISLDRFFVIKYPLNRKYSKLRIKISLIISWIYAILFSSIPLLDTEYGTFVPEGLLTSCSFDYLTDHEKIKIFIFTFFTAAWIIPMLIITFSYVNIVIAVLQSKGTKMGSQKNESFRHCKEEKNKQEIRLAFIIFSIIILWFLAWTPYATVALLGIFGQKNLITPMNSMIPAMFCKTASCVDPFIYALSHTKFKKELDTLLCGWKKNRTKKPKPLRPTIKKKSKKIQKTPDFEEYSNDDDVEIEFIRIDSIKPPEKQKTREELEEEFRNIESDIDDLNSACSKWIFKPNFSNRPSSLRRLARSMSLRGSFKSENRESY